MQFASVVSLTYVFAVECYVAHRSIVPLLQSFRNSNRLNDQLSTHSWPRLSASLLYHDAGITLVIEIQRGKEAMQQQPYCQELGATAACSIRLCGDAAYSGAPSLDSRSDAKAEGSPESFIGDSWFTGVKVCEWASEQGYAYFGALKTSTKYTPFIREHNMQGALCLWAEHILPVDSRTSCIWTQRVVHTVWRLSIMCCLYAGRVPARLHSMICG
jgi:hypothetical protein